MKLPSNISENHENRLARRLVRPDPVKLRGKSSVWSVRSSRTPLSPRIAAWIAVFHFLPYFWTTTQTSRHWAPVSEPGFLDFHISDYRVVICAKYF